LPIAEVLYCSSAGAASRRGNCSRTGCFRFRRNSRGEPFCDTGHGVGVMIARGQDAGPGRQVGKQRRGMHVIGEHAAFCRRVKIRRFDRTAVTSTSQLVRAGAILHDEQSIGCAPLPAQQSRPWPVGDIERSVSSRGVWRSESAFFKCHVSSFLSFCWCSPYPLRTLTSYSA
jgi:hypothetical protein